MIVVVPLSQAPGAHSVPSLWCVREEERPTLLPVPLSQAPAGLLRCCRAPDDRSQAGEALHEALEGGPTGRSRSEALEGGGAAATTAAAAAAAAPAVGSEAGLCSRAGRAPSPGPPGW